MNENLLVGYARRANEGAKIKLSINTQAMKDCRVYETSDGQQYVSLSMSLSAIRKVMDGERAVTTISHQRSE